MSLTPMRQSCVWNELTSSGLYGPVFTAHANTACRFAQETKTVKRPNSQEVISTAVIRTAAAVGSDDTITYGGITYPVLTVQEIIGMGGGIIEYEIRL